MGKKTEYLVSKFDWDADKCVELRAPKGADIRLLLERLICRELNDEELVASCLRKNSRRAFDPFQIVDVREDYRREQARAALSADPDTPDPIGTYERARQASIPLGKVILFAGIRSEFSVKEVEMQSAKRKVVGGQDV